MLLTDTTTGSSDIYRNLPGWNHPITKHNVSLGKKVHDAYKKYYQQELEKSEKKSLLQNVCLISCDWCVKSDSCAYQRELEKSLQEWNDKSTKECLFHIQWLMWQVWHPCSVRVAHRRLSSSRFIMSCLFQGGMDCILFSSASCRRCSSASFLAFSAAFLASICLFQSGMRFPAGSVSGTWKIKPLDYKLNTDIGNLMQQCVWGLRLSWISRI